MSKVLYSLIGVLAVGLVVVTFLAIPTDGQDPEKSQSPKLDRAMDKLRPLHSKLGKPKPGEWLDKHKERGQTFAQYERSHPVTPTGKRKVIYIQPLGDFTPVQRKIVTLTADYMSRYFNRRVKISKDLPMSVIPKHARRKHPQWHVDQILSTYVLDDVLKPRLPKDAASYVAFTATDLWPGEGWNFVFGQASLSDRVGVWSFNRFGDPSQGEEAFRLCLLRTIKTATHESGHMLSIPHCIAYQCNMCGSNSLDESDRRPLASCPECMAKVCWATGADPLERTKKLSEFCKEQGLTKQQKFFNRSIEALSK